MTVCKPVHCRHVINATGGPSTAAGGTNLINGISVNTETKRRNGRGKHVKRVAAAAAAAVKELLVN